MSRYRVRSSFLNFDNTFDSMEEVELFVKTRVGEEMLKIDEVRNHFIDKNVPFFGVKGIIITKEVSNQEVNERRDDKTMEMM